MPTGARGRAGDALFCVPGFTADGHDFAPDAVRRAPRRSSASDRSGSACPRSWCRACAPRWAGRGGLPRGSDRGAAGPRGDGHEREDHHRVPRAAVLEAHGISTGLLGTVQSVVGGQVEEVERTTPEAIDLQATFRRMVDAGDRACVMEVSSHALDLHRAAGIEFDCAVFTNLTQDHLDFHGTLDDYFGGQAAAVRARGGRRPRRGGRQFGRRVGCAGLPTRSRPRAHAGHDLRARAARRVSRENVRTTRPAPTFECHRGARRSTCACRCRASSTSTTRWARSPRRTRSAWRRTAPPKRSRPRSACPGASSRSTRVRDSAVLVDYAHTPDSLENVLRAARELLDQAGGGRLIVRVRRGRRPGPREAAADGRGRAAPRRPRRS